MHQQLRDVAHRPCLVDGYGPRQRLVGTQKSRQCFREICAIGWFVMCVVRLMCRHGISVLLGATLVLAQRPVVNFHHARLLASVRTPAEFTARTCQKYADLASRPPMVAVRALPTLTQEVSQILLFTRSTQYS